MGFKIRDKSLFWTRSGWKNNWEPRILNMPRPVNPASTVYVINRSDHHSFLRMVQSYRNYSRICKQYLYGDKAAEEVLQMELRYQFHIPFNSDTPCHLIKHGPERRMADQLDRDYELLTHNYHPYQLYMYDSLNKYVRENNENYELKSKGEKSLADVVEEELKREVEEEKKKLPVGERIPFDKLTEIIKRVATAAHQHMGHNQQPKADNGQFNDFLEKRRPFMSPNPGRAGH